MDIYDISSDGEYEKINIKFSELNGEGAYLFADIIKKRVYIWKGSSAPVRLKFISARVAQELRQREYGMAYKVESIEQGDEPQEFLSFVGASVPSGQTPSGQPQQPSTPVISARPSQPISSSRPTIVSRPAASTRPTTASRPTATARPVSMTRSTTSTNEKPTQQAISRPVTKIPSHPKMPSSEGSAVNSSPRSQEGSTQFSSPSSHPTTSVPNQEKDIGDEIIKETVEILKDLEEPEGMQREIVIIGSRVFSAYKEFHKLFKKEILKLDPMDDLPDGEFPASDYYTRLFVKNHKIKFIELFSEIPRSEREEFLSDMRSSLRDLTKLGI